MGMINGLIKQLQDMLLLYGNKIILTISDGENEYGIKSITGKPCAKYFEPKDKVAEVTITVKPTVEAIPKADYEARLKADMAAMLEELDLTIDEISIVTRHGVTGTVMTAQGMRKKIKENIQHKINALKENSHDD